MKQKGIGTSVVVATIAIVAIVGISSYLALKGGEEIKEGEGEEGTPEPTATGDVWVAIWNDDYGFHDVSVFLNGELMAHDNHFANGYWGLVSRWCEPSADNTGPYVVTGTYELKIKVNWFGSDYWTSRTFMETVGDEPAHTYYGIEGIPVGTPDVLYVDGVWSKFYWIVIEEGGVGGAIGLHY